MIDSAATKAVQQLGYTAMKPEQLQVHKLESHGVFAVLPTGFGKRLCCLLSVYDQVLPAHEPPIVLVVTPLTALRFMKDQVSV